MAKTKRSTRPVDVLVGHNIRICRMQQGLSQTELGQRVGLTFQQIQKYENGANRVGAGRLIQVAGALGVPLGALFDGTSTAHRGEPDPYDRNLLTQPHALRLAQAFDQIPDSKRRAAVLDLVDSLANRQARRKAAR